MIGCWPPWSAGRQGQTNIDKERGLDEKRSASFFSFVLLQIWGSCGCIEPSPRYNIAASGLCLPELGSSVLELSVFLQPKHGAFNNGTQDAFVVCAVPLQLGPRLFPFSLLA